MSTFADDLKILCSTRGYARLAKHGMDNAQALAGLMADASLEALVPADAALLRASYSLGKALAAAAPLPRVFHNPTEVSEYYFHRMHALEQEHAYAVFLTQDMAVIGERLIGIGTADTVMAHPRDIFREALRAGAHAFILLHNHPNGEPTPSEADKQLTISINKAGQMVGLQLMDHIVIGERSYASVFNAINEDRAKAAQESGPIDSDLIKRAIRVLSERA